MANGKLRESMKLHACLKGIEEAESPLKKSQELGEVAKIGKEIEEQKSELDHF